VEGRLGSERDIAETGLFAPLFCTERELVYTDIRYKRDDRDNHEGNLGVGWRSLQPRGIAGGYIYLDRRRSGVTEKLHTQVTLGAEWLAEDWEARGNVYAPLTGEKFAGAGGGQALGDPFLAGSGIFVNVAGAQVIAEKPLAGIDAEAGLKLPGTDFWLHAGAFAFDAHEAEGLAGGRLRATWNITENIALTAEAQQDDLRGRQGWLGVRLTVPFGGGPAKKHEGLKARMTANPVRDVDIVTAAVQRQATPDSVQPILNAETGDAQRVLYVDNTAAPGGAGTKEDPYNTLAAAEAALQDHDVIYVNRGDGTSAGMDAGIAIANDGVQLIGSGTDFVYDQGRFRSTTGESFSGTVLAAAGLAPVITNLNANSDGVLVTGADALIGGITVDGATRHGIYVRANAGAGNLGNVTVHNVTVTDNVESGVLIETDGIGAAFDTATVRNVTATGNANRGIYALIENGGVMGMLELDGLTAETNNGVGVGGISITSNGAGSLIENIRLINSTASNNITGGISLQAANGGIIDDAATSNLVTMTNGGIGFQVTSQLNGLISEARFSDLTTTGNTGQGLYLVSQAGGEIASAAMDDITSQNNTSRGIQVLATGAGSLISSATIDNATVSGNGTEGIHLQGSLGGVLSTTSVTNAISTGNGAAGIHVIAQAGGTVGAAEIIDSASNANTGQGIYVLNQTVSTMGTVIISDVTVQNNVGATGRGIEVVSQSAGSVFDTLNIAEATVSGNAQQGLWVNANAGVLNTVNISQITSSANAGQGARVLAQADGDIGTVAIDNLTSQNNTGASGRGLEVTATGAGSTIGTTTVTDSAFSGNALQGYYTNNTSGGIINTLTLQDTQSTNNTAQGVYVLLQTNGDIGTLLADGLTVQNNVGGGGNTGMEITSQNTGSLITSATIRNSDFSNNGRGLSVTATTDGDISMLDIDNVTASNNTALNGILINSTGGGSMITTATVQNITASGNISHGIQIQSTTNALIGTATISNATTSSNASRGVFITAAAGADITTVMVDDVTSQNNTGANGRGLELSATGAGSTITTATIQDSVFTGNASIGAYLTPATSGSIGTLNVSGVTSSGNAAQGIMVQALNDGDLGTATLEDIIANNNTGANGVGVQVIAIGVGSTITSATIDNASASGNAVFGLYGTAATSGVLNNIEMRNSVSSGNTSVGYEIFVQSNGVINTAVLADSVADGNGSNGGYILASTGGDIGTATVERFTSQNNTGVNGRGLTIQTSGAGSTITSASAIDSLLSGNTQQGLLVQASTDADIGAVMFDGLTSRDNGTAGAQITVTDNGTTLGGLTVQDSLLEDNGTAGLFLQSTTFASMTGVEITGVTSTGNANEGFNFFALNNGILSLRMQDSTATGNGTNGVYIDDDTPAAYTADLGGGALGGIGGNRIFGNTGTELRVDHDGAQLKAENNWWGNAAGLLPAELTLEGGSTADTTPFLAADPGP
jgi:hypothetical protein